MTTWVTPRSLSCCLRPVLANAPGVFFTIRISVGSWLSSGTRSVNPAGSSLCPRAGPSVRPGAVPATTTKTTGRPFLRKASASRLVFSTTVDNASEPGNMPAMPFCKSMTIRADFGSIAVTGKMNSFQRN